MSILNTFRYRNRLTRTEGMKPALIIQCLIYPSKYTYKTDLMRFRNPSDLFLVSWPHTFLSSFNRLISSGNLCVRAFFHCNIPSGKHISKANNISNRNRHNTTTKTTSHVLTSISLSNTVTFNFPRHAPGTHLGVSPQREYLFHFLPQIYFNFSMTNRRSLPAIPQRYTTKAVNTEANKTNSTKRPQPS